MKKNKFSENGGGKGSAWIVWAGIIIGYCSVVNSAPHDGWDLLVFSQNWPRSLCSIWNETKHNYEYQCNAFPNNTWTIHGLWPSRHGGYSPTFCRYKKFHHEAIYGIEGDLEKAWSQVIKKKKKYTFWAHEWEKHGTCAASHPRFTTQFDYFYEVLQLFKEYNMSRILERAHISPGQLNNVTRIWNGVKRILNKKPQVICRQGENGISLLTEIRVCLNKQLKAMDCEGWMMGEDKNTGGSETNGKKGGLKELTNCRIKALVHYPHSHKLPTRRLPPTSPPKSQNINPLLEKLSKFIFTSRSQKNAT